MKNNENVAITTLTGETLGIRPGRAEAKTALLVYGYKNDSITDKVMTTVNI